MAVSPARRRISRGKAIHQGIERHPCSTAEGQRLDWSGPIEPSPSPLRLVEAQSFEAVRCNAAQCRCRQGLRPRSPSGRRQALMGRILAPQPPRCSRQRMCVNIRPTENLVDGLNRLAYTGRGNGASPPKDGVRPHAPSMHSRAGCMLCGGVEAGPACAEPASFHPYFTSRTGDRPYDTAAKLTGLRPDQSCWPVAACLPQAAHAPARTSIFHFPSKPCHAMLLSWIRRIGLGAHAVDLSLPRACLPKVDTGFGRQALGAGTGLDHAAARTGSLRNGDRDALSAVLTLRELET